LNDSHRNIAADYPLII